MRVTRLLGFKLFLIITVVMFTGTMVFTTFTVVWHTKQYIRTASTSVTQISDVILRSMHYSMLPNRREDIDHIIRTIGNEPGIEAVCISINKNGVNTFSSNADEGTAFTISLPRQPSARTRANSEGAEPPFATSSTTVV